VTKHVIRQGFTFWFSRNTLSGSYWPAKGEFSVHPKSVSASGEFVYLDPNHEPLVSGTWEATGLISFDFYGCRFISALEVDWGTTTCAEVRSRCAPAEDSVVVDADPDLVEVDQQIGRVETR
jgi:hypothetical protein